MDEQVWKATGMWVFWIGAMGMLLFIVSFFPGK